MGDRMSMKKLILAVILLALPSCATLQEINDNKAKSDARRAAADRFKQSLTAFENSDSPFAKLVKDYELDSHPERLEFLLNLRESESEAAGREIDSPLEVLDGASRRITVLAMQMATSAMEYCVKNNAACKKDQYLQQAVKTMNARYVTLKACDEGNGEACMAVAQVLGEYHPATPGFHKKACFGGNQAGCTLHQIRKQEEMAARAEAAEAERASTQNFLMYQAIQSNNRPAPASVPAFTPVQTRQRMNCTSQRFGNQVQTNCY